MFKEMKETHQKGFLSIENLELIKDMLMGSDDGSATMNVDLGIQIAGDGRVWICVDSVALLRFKPNAYSGTITGRVSSKVPNMKEVDRVTGAVTEIVTDPCPDCGKQLMGGDTMGGVKCPDVKGCGYWFCY